MSDPRTIVKNMFDTCMAQEPESLRDQRQPGAATTGAPGDPRAAAPKPLERLEAEICELAGHLAAATCQFLVLLAEFDAREGWADWGVSSCAAWLSWKCAVASGTAREHVRVARCLPTLPAIRAEFAAGRLSYAKVRALTRIAEPESDADLAEMAAPMTANQLERFARAHRKVTGIDDEARLARRLTWRHDEDGSLRITVHLPPEDGAAVLTALRAAVRPAEHPAEQPAEHPAEQPPEEPAVRRAGQARGQSTEDAGVSAETLANPRPTSTSLADALVEIAESFIASKSAAADNPDIYHVIVHADPASLAGRPGGRCHVDDGPALSTDTLQMLTCDSLISWMRHDARGNVIDVGRRHRQPPPALRRALRERDRCRCRFPGCNNRRTDAHHVRAWAKGGPTSLANMTSLCRYHHRLVHMCGYQIKAVASGFEFYRPDGTLIENSPPLPALEGQLADRHDAEITPGTITPPWYGERLDLDYAIAVCFSNQRVREERRSKAARRADTEVNENPWG
jgi:hypothetical protein